MGLVSSFDKFCWQGYKRNNKQVEKVAGDLLSRMAKDSKAYHARIDSVGIIEKRRLVYKRVVLFVREAEELTQLTVGRCRRPVDRLHVMRLAEDPVFVQSEFFSGAELSFASFAGETRQMVDVLARLSHPISGRNAAGAFRTFRSETSGTDSKDMLIPLWRFRLRSPPLDQRGICS